MTGIAPAELLMLEIQFDPGSSKFGGKGGDKAELPEKESGWEQLGGL